MATDSPRIWPKTSTRQVGDFRIFQLREDFPTNPRTGRNHGYYVIECVDWVNVIALTKNLEIVMVEQFRHGTETIELEIPGGMMDPEESDPLATGIRELQEETGYTGHRSEHLGWIYPNVAIMNNKCHTVLVHDCELTHRVEFDSGEDLVTRLVPWKDLPGLIESGKIRHSLVVVALHHFWSWQKRAHPSLPTPIPTIPTKA